MYNFIIVSFTSYNLDSSHKNSVGYVGITVVIIMFGVAIAFRIYEIITNWKTPKGQQAADAKRNATQINLVNENDLYNSEVESEQENKPNHNNEMEKTTNKVGAKTKIIEHSSFDENKIDQKAKEAELSQLEEFKIHEELKF